MDLVKDIKQIILLNKEEALILTKEYFIVYLMSLIKDPKGNENRKILIDKLREYYAITREENNYMRYLLDNISSISNEESLNRVFDDLDRLNRQTYCYYDSILGKYEDNIFYDTLDRKIVPPKTFLTLIETDEYLDEILGLVLTGEDLDEYFAEVEEFAFLKTVAKTLNYSCDTEMDFYGCYPQVDQYDKVKGLKICVPRINDLKSMCINIHEFRHALDVYKYFDMVFPALNYEESAKREEEKFKIFLRKRYHLN